MELKYGTVSETKAGFVKVRLQDQSGIVTKWLPVTLLQTHGTKAVRPIALNTFVACLMDGNCEEGICFGGVYNSQQTPPDSITDGVMYSDGTIIDYDPLTRTLKVNGPLQINIEAPLVNITGALTVSGVVAVGGLASATPGATLSVDGALSATGDISSGTTSLKTHTHSGVSTGPGVSGPPLL